jgi:hypothetical protein
MRCLYTGRPHAVVGHDVDPRPGGDLERLDANESVDGDVERLDANESVDGDVQPGLLTYLADRAVLERFAAVRTSARQPPL